LITLNRLIMLTFCVTILEVIVHKRFISGDLYGWKNRWND